MVVNADTMRLAVETYFDSFARRDLETLLSIFAENATVEDPVGSTPVAGKDNIRPFYERALAMDLTLTHEGAIRLVENYALFPFRINAQRRSGPMEIDCIDMFTFDEAGKVTSMRAFFGPANIRATA